MRLASTREVAPFCDIDLSHRIAVKRIMQEARELANDPSTEYSAAPLEVCPIVPPLYFTRTLTPHPSCALLQDDIFVRIFTSLVPLPRIQRL